MLEIPIPEITWSTANALWVWISERLKIEVELKKTSPNPFIMVAYNIARVTYQLVIRTHGWPRHQPEVIFSDVKKLGEVVKNAVSPSVLGDVDGSMRLKIFKDELPSNSEVSLDVSFEIEVDTEDLFTMDFAAGHETIDQNHKEIEVLCTNLCEFPLEQVFLIVKKDVRLRVEDVRVLILDKGSHKELEEIEKLAIRKGDEYIKWISRFAPREAMLFKVVVT